MTKINFTIWAPQVWLHLEVVLDLSTMNLRKYLWFLYCFSKTDLANALWLKETDTNEYSFAEDIMHVKNCTLKQKLLEVQLFY